MYDPAPRGRSTRGGARRLVLVGNSNVGKSVLFHCLTGRYVTVSNYPGTTVEIAAGRGRLGDAEWEILDTPGVDGLAPDSEEGLVTRDLLLRSADAVVLQVIDAKNLRRGLLLTLQLGDLGLPLVIALNMTDEARSRGLAIRRDRLEEILGVPVVETVAVERRGIGRLVRRLAEACPPKRRTPCPEAFERALEAARELLALEGRGDRGVAYLALVSEGEPAGPVPISPAAQAELAALRRAVARELGQAASLALARARLEEADRIVAETVTSGGSRGGGRSARLGELSMHPVWGLPILLAVLSAVYLFVGKLGAQTLVDVLEGRLFGRLLAPAAIRLADLLAPFPHSHRIQDGVAQAAYALSGDAPALARFAHDLLVGEYGLITMALAYSVGIVLPVVATFFVAFGVLEDSGYLPRLAVTTDRVFRAMGLNGKAVLPMILGLGCDTMATLTTRILETRKERLLATLLLALAVPCSAQLGVILGLLGALGLPATLLWAGVVLASLLLVGIVAARVLPGERADFLLEIPPLRVPRLGNILAKTVARVEWYVREAVPLFVLGTLILFLLDRLGLLSRIERAAEPLVAGVLGLPPQAADAFLVGFLRRDYGAAGLFHLFSTGALDPKQAVVSLVTITLFVPCLANLLVIVKEQGAKVALGIAAFVFPLAFAVGGLVRLALGRIPL